MTTPSLEQRLALLAALGLNMDWNAITAEQAQVGIGEAQRAGAEFTAFVKNGFRVQIGDFLRSTGEFTVTIPALPRPTLRRLQVKYPSMNIASIERDCSPTEVVTMNLATVLSPNEMKLVARCGGAEYERRLASCLNDLHGLQQLEWLVDHQDEHPAFKALLGKIYVDGPAIVVYACGSRCVPVLGSGGWRWRLLWLSLGSDFCSDGRVASSRK